MHWELPGKGSLNGSNIKHILKSKGTYDMKNENVFQSNVIKRIKSMLPGAIVLKNDSSYIQGIPDLSVFYGRHWAMLECKKGEFESHQPNQDYYVAKAANDSFGAFIFPENEDDVLNALYDFMTHD
jgi:hypothetical protein